MSQPGMHPLPPALAGRPPAPSVEPGMLRHACGLFVTGVTVVTSGTGEEAAGTTVNSFTSVSLQPPLVLFCLHNDSRLRTVVERSGAYVVNFLAGGQGRLARAFAGRESAGIREVPHHHTDTGMPVLSEALAFLSCRLVSTLEGGDHTIFLGEVIRLGMQAQYRDPLIFFRGSLGALEDEDLRRGNPIFDG
jgi:3-hydroxy-9,10-secoandrosta-1,3,5(10)-triene-9,17-dione monooxygenase reductase component